MSSSAPRRVSVLAVVLLLGLLLAGWILFFRPPAAGKPSRAGTATTTPPAAPVVAAPPPAGSGLLKNPVPADETGRGLDEARTLRNPAQRALEFGRRLQELIAHDPAAALAYVRQLPPGAEYTQGLLLVLAAIGRSDSDRALALAGELTSTREQRAIYSLLFAQLAAADPRAAVARLARVPAGEGRDNALRALADGWARADWPAALDWAQKLDRTDRAPAMEAVIAELTSTDPRRAIALARQTLTGAPLERTVVAAVQALTLTDPPAAAAITSKLPPGLMQTQAALTVARALAAQNPAEALAWARTLPADGVQGMVLNNILEVWVARDPVSAGQYVGQMKAGPEQTAAAGHLASLLAKDPPGAISWAQSLGDEAARNTAFVNLASAWAQHDPAAAARWAGSLAASEVRTQALNSALSYWVMQDSSTAQRFIFDLTGETQAAAAAYLAPGLAQKDPVAAIAWTQTLPSAAARDAALAAAYARWRGNAPVAAKTWLAGADLPAATKAKLAAQP